MKLVAEVTLEIEAVRHRFRRDTRLSFVIKVHSLEYFNLQTEEIECGLFSGGPTADCGFWFSDDDGNKDTVLKLMQVVDFVYWWP